MDAILQRFKFFYRLLRDPPRWPRTRSYGPLRAMMKAGWATYRGFLIG